MLFIKFRQGLRVKKYRGCTFKVDTMFSHILSGFDRIPFKLISEGLLHVCIISQAKLMGGRTRRDLTRPAAELWAVGPSVPAASSAGGGGL